MASQNKIKIIGKERIKLDAQKTAFGQQCAVLFDTGQEVFWRVIFRKYNGFATECAYLGAANIKGVAAAGNDG